MANATAGIDVGIDLGTAYVKIFTPGQGVVLFEPAVVALDKDTDEILAIGAEAYKMLGRTSDRIATVYPLRGGVISDYELTKAMLNEYVRRVCGTKVIMPRVVVCVPIGVSEVERRAVVDVLRSAGARKVCLIEEAVAAALGAGVDISLPYGTIVCDIGAGTTDIGVISLNGLSVSDSIKIAGNAFDAAIVKYIKKKYNLIIGERMAEEIKKEIGCAFLMDKMDRGKVAGRDGRTGLPKNIPVTSDELLEALEEPCVYICRAVQGVLERTKPELVSDIYERGMVLTGGGARLHGMDKFLSSKTRLSVILANDPQSCVVLGTGEALDYMEPKNEVEFAVSPLEVYSF